MRIVGLVILFVFTINFGYVYGQVQSVGKRPMTDLQKIQMLNVFKALNPQDQLIISHRFLKFAEERKKVKCSFLILNNLAKAATAPEAPETLDCINTWIAFIDSNPELPENFIAGKPVNDVAVLSKGRFFDTSRASGCPFD